MSKFLGGIAVSEVAWLSATAIRVSFTSVNAGMLHQLYYGRRLVAETSNTTQRRLVAQIDGGRWQNQLTVLAVSGSDIGVDHGDDLPPNAYNSVKLNFDASGLEADTNVIKVFRSDEAGGALNTDTPIKVMPFEGAATYTLFTPPFPGSGNWPIRVVGYDDKPSGGNVGTEADDTVDIIAAPPDFDDPFTASAVSNIVTVSAVIPVD